MYKEYGGWDKPNNPVVTQVGTAIPQQDHDAETDIAKHGSLCL